MDCRQCENRIRQAMEMCPFNERKQECFLNVIGYPKHAIPTKDNNLIRVAKGYRKYPPNRGDGFFAYKVEMFFRYEGKGKWTSAPFSDCLKKKIIKNRNNM